jgi:hypothetical protein
MPVIKFKSQMSPELTQSTDMEDFFIKSIEHRTYHVTHECVVREVVDGNKLLVDLVQAIPMWVYDSDKDLDVVVLAPRYEGSTLTPTISEWPCIVNICLPKDSSGGWTSGPWRLLDIAEASKI